MKSTCSEVFRRSLGVAGFLIGFGLLSAGVASADDDSPGLLGGVTSLVAPVTDPVLKTVTPVTGSVLKVVTPVTDPVLKAVAPVTQPVLAPLAPAVDSVVRTLGPVLEPLQPVTAPVLAPVVRTVRDVPVVPRIAEPLVAQQSVPADVPPVPDVPLVPDAPQTPAWVAAPEVHTSALPPRVAAVVAEAPQRQQISAPEAAPPIKAPQQPLPDVPLALPGTMGSVSSSGSASPVMADLPARQGVHPHRDVHAVDSNDWIHGSWCYYYGRSHPS